MDYFLLKQDERYKNTPHLSNVFKKINIKDLNLFDCNKISNILVFSVQNERNTTFLDVLDNQIYLISKEMKKILDKFNADILFKDVALLDHYNKRQGNYSLPIFKEINALSDRSEFNMNKTIVKKIVLDSQKIKGEKIFKLAESSKTLVVVRLDVAEFLLRRNFKGIKLERLEID